MSSVTRAGPPRNVPAHCLPEMSALEDLSASEGEYLTDMIHQFLVVVIFISVLKLNVTAVYSIMHWLAICILHFYSNQVT